MFRIRAYSTNTCLACFDLAVIACCYVAVVWVELSPGQNSLFWDLSARDHLIGLALVWSIWIALSIYFGLYKSRWLDSPFADLGILIKTVFESCVILVILRRRVT